jgi:altronate hydrolase
MAAKALTTPRRRCVAPAVFPGVSADADIANPPVRVPAMTPLLRLAPTDPVAVATRDIEAGEQVRLDDLSLVIAVDVPLGHKVALRQIEAGERVEKYRVPIGTATAAIAPGEIVHTHNLRSNYIPTFTLEPGHRFGEET